MGDEELTVDSRRRRTTRRAQRGSCIMHDGSRNDRGRDRKEAERKREETKRENDRRDRSSRHTPCWQRKWRRVHETREKALMREQAAALAQQKFEAVPGCRAHLGARYRGAPW
jgi:hypothetical protein